MFSVGRLGMHLWSLFWAFIGLRFKNKLFDALATFLIEPFSLYVNKLGQEFKPNSEQGNYSQPSDAQWYAQPRNTLSTTNSVFYLKLRSSATSLSIRPAPACELGWYVSPPIGNQARGRSASPRNLIRAFVFPEFWCVFAFPELGRSVQLEEWRAAAGLEREDGLKP